MTGRTVFACDCGWRGREPAILARQESVEFWGAVETMTIHYGRGPE